MCHIQYFPHEKIYMKKMGGKLHKKEMEILNKETPKEDETQAFEKVLILTPKLALP